jgi:hypothetical protein
MPGLDQPARHRETHFPEADESDFHGAASSALVQPGEYFARDAKTVDCGGHAAIDRDLHQDLADFVAGDAIGQRALRCARSCVAGSGSRSWRY